MTKVFAQQPGLLKHQLIARTDRLTETLVDIMVEIKDELSRSGILGWRMSESGILLEILCLYRCIVLTLSNSHYIVGERTPT